MKAGVSGRVCYGCGKGYGVYAIGGAYWHHRHYQKATPAQRSEARQAMAQDMAARTAEIEETTKRRE